VIIPPDYNRDYILYLLASIVSVAGVLVQLGDDDLEHVIYYVSKNLSRPPLKYNHEEKLALAVVLAVHKLRHYILLRTTKVVIDFNPMQYLLSRRKSMENFLDGSSSFRSTTLNFTHPRERNPSSFPNSLPHFLFILPTLPSIPNSPMNISFSSLQMTLGMVISSSTSKHRSSKTTSPGMIIDVFNTRPPNTFLSVISYIGEGLTPYFIDF
jgi:hypothetical protein